MWVAYHVYSGEFVVLYFGFKPNLTYINASLLLMQLKNDFRRILKLVRTMPSIFPEKIMRENAFPSRDTSSHMESFRSKDTIYLFNK